MEASPTDDYAQFGLGLALARAGDPGAAAEHLALAAAMRPELRHYTDALRGVRATLRAQGPSSGGRPAMATGNGVVPSDGEPTPAPSGRAGSTIRGAARSR